MLISLLISGSMIRVQLGEPYSNKYLQMLAGHTPLKIQLGVGWADIELAQHPLAVETTANYAVALWGNS